MKWITVSRKMGTHGSDIAKQAASELGYRFYDTKAINHMAQELGVLGSVREIDEKVPPIFQRIFSPRPMVYLERLYSVIFELAKQGDAIASFSVSSAESMGRRAVQLALILRAGARQFMDLLEQEQAFLPLLERLKR